MYECSYFNRKAYPNLSSVCTSAGISVRGENFAWVWQMPLVFLSFIHESFWLGIGRDHWGLRRFLPDEWNERDSIRTAGFLGLQWRPAEDTAASDGQLPILRPKPVQFVPEPALLALIHTPFAKDWILIFTYLSSLLLFHPFLLKLNLLPNGFENENSCRKIRNTTSYQFCY